MVKHGLPGVQRSLSDLSSHIKSVSPVKRQRRDTSEKDVDAFEPWYIRYAPQSLNEVAIHKRKLEDVSRLLEAMLSGRNETRIMLLTGPSGCSKSTVVKQLAKQLVPRYRTNNSGLLRSHERDDACDYIVEFLQLEHFQEFLTGAKYRVGKNLSVVLVEDLPNVFHVDTRLAFQRVLLEWLYSSEENLPPLVICLTECEMVNESSNGYGVEYSFVAESVLGKEILSHPKLRRVKFNPINTTLMKKYLKSVCMANRSYLIPKGKWSQKDLVIDQLATMTGDIRSAIASLQYWATSSGDAPFATREESLTYFHTIGKVLYGSHQCGDHDMVNSLIMNSKLHLSNDNFRLGLLENYRLVNGGKLNVEAASSIVECLSQSDSLGALSESLEFAVRKVRHTLSSVDKTHMSHTRSNFPREWKMRQLQKEFQVLSQDYANVDFYKYGHSSTERDICLYLAYYGPLIRAKRNYKRNSLKLVMSKLDRDARELVVKQNDEVLSVDPDIDVLERVGGSIKIVDEQHEVVSVEDSEALGRQSLDRLKQLCGDKLKKLQLLQVAEEPEADTEVLEDPILDTDVEDDDSIYDFLSQKRPTLNESLSDSDLEDL